MKKKDINGYQHVQFDHEEIDPETSLRNSENFFNWINKRRSVRDISDQPVSKDIIDNIIRSASSAPSGAHKQPWTFCIVSDPGIKHEIRKAAEKEEYESYHNRMSARWLKDLQPIGTDWNKPFLEKAPYLIIVFKKVFELDEDDQKQNNYYVNESVGIASGFLIAAIHNAGLVTLTHTPSPMNFLNSILKRPPNEKPFVLLVVGKPKDDCEIPVFATKKKSFSKIATEF